MRAEMGGGMPGPARVVENRPRERDQVGVAGADNGFGLFKLGDEPDGDHGHPGRRLYGARERHLIARADRDPLGRIETAARDVNGGAAVLLEPPRKGDRLVDVPAAFHQSVPDTRMVTARSGGKTARTASKTSSGKRMRF